MTWNSDWQTQDGESKRSNHRATGQGAHQEARGSNSWFYKNMPGASKGQWGGICASLHTDLSPQRGKKHLQAEHHPSFTLLRKLPYAGRANWGGQQAQLGLSWEEPTAPWGAGFNVNDFVCKPGTFTYCKQPVLALLWKKNCFDEQPNQACLIPVLHLPIK